MPTYALTIAYDGFDFHGWQRQVRPALSPGESPVEMRTVQGEIERALREVIRDDTSILGASRTDAGVHAYAQVAVFRTSATCPRPPDERLALALNSRLPPDVRIRRCTRVSNGFHPIRSCVSKGYRYTIAFGPIAPLWDRRFVHHTYEPSLDIRAMICAAGALVGEHDFAAFTNAGHGKESTIRTVFTCEVNQSAPDRIVIDVSSGGFIYNMVRIIAGALLEVGKGRADADRLREALRTGERTLSGPTLPPCGLRLEWIRYAGSIETDAYTADAQRDRKELQERQ